MITQDQITELRALLEKATSLPWIRSENSVSQEGGAMAVCAIADCSRATRYGPGTGHVGYDETEANAELIATAINALPALLDAAERSLKARSAHNCKARTSSLPEPQDCNWPHCDCDPNANRVIAALEEEGIFDRLSLAENSDEIHHALYIQAAYEADIQRQLNMLLVHRLEQMEARLAELVREGTTCTTCRHQDLALDAEQCRSCNENFDLWEYARP